MIFCTEGVPHNWRGGEPLRATAITKQQLRQLRWLKSEIKLLREQIENMKYPVVIDSVIGSSNRFPYNERPFIISGIDVEAYERKTAKLRKQLEQRADELIDLVAEATIYVEQIDDSLIRQIIILRHVNGLQWDDVAAHIGGGNTGDGVRKMHDRFLKGEVKT